MAQDTVDAVVDCKDVGQKRSPSIEVLNCEMPDRYQKDRGKRVLRSLLNRLRLRRTASVDISQPDPSYKVAYLGNVVTGWAKGKRVSFILKITLEEIDTLLNFLGLDFVYLFTKLFLFDKKRN